MELQSLGYVGLRAKNLDDWESYGTRLLGMQRVDKTASTLALRMDDRKQRVIVNADGGEGIGFFGFEVADARRAERACGASWRATASASRAACGRWPTNASSRT